jgi:hypothetical protein
MCPVEFGISAILCKPRRDFNYLHFSIAAQFEEVEKSWERRMKYQKEQIPTTPNRRFVTLHIRKTRLNHRFAGQGVVNAALFSTPPHQCSKD